MLDFDRRGFLKAGAALGLSGLAGRSGVALAAQPRGLAVDAEVSSKAVRFVGDGLGLTPDEYARLLAQLAAAKDFTADAYAIGGIIEELEQKFARLLGKETAVFLPTGTLANHLALRRLTSSRQRVVVQADSHIYNDSGDCAQRLSGMNLLPIEGAFTPDSISEALRKTAAGKVKTGVGAIFLESPLRRGFNTTHSLAQVAEIAELARNEGIPLHLDGARLFMQAAHQGFSPGDYAAHFDTVYVSLYKNFNAAAGAVLAGTADMLAGLYHERRMFGGSPCHAWPLAAVALLFADDFIAEYRQARVVTDQLIDILKADSRFRFAMIPDGSNSLWLRLDGVDPATFVQRLAERDIHLREPQPGWDGLLITINPTIGRARAEDLAAAFQAAAEA